MSIMLRSGNTENAKRCGAICYEAFKNISEHHNFPPDFPSPEIAAGLLGSLFAHPGFYSVVAEIDGRIVGSNFLDERSIIAGIGPITVDPAAQNSTVGRQLMQTVLNRVSERGLPGCRPLRIASISAHPTTGGPCAARIRPTPSRAV